MAVRRDIVASTNPTFIMEKKIISMDLNYTGPNATEISSGGIMGNKTTSEFAEFRNISLFIIGIVEFLLMPMILVGNVLVLISIAKFRFLRTATNIFIASLACADTLQGAVAVPTYAAMYLYKDLNRQKYPCFIKFLSVLCSLAASLLSLLAVSVDRYISILQPLKYQMIMTSQRARKIVIALWMYTVIICTIPIFWNFYDEESESPCRYFVIFPKIYTVIVSYIPMFIVMLISFYLYVRIFIVAKRHRKMYLERQAQLGSKTIKDFQKETKSAQSMAVILFLFFAFWFPLQVIGPLGYLDLDVDLVETLKDYALCFAMSNSFVNPIVYCWLRKDFKLAFYKLFHKDTRGLYKTRPSICDQSKALNDRNIRFSFSWYMR